MCRCRMGGEREKPYWVVDSLMWSVCIWHMISWLAGNLVDMQKSNITTNQKANNKANSGNITTLHHQRTPEWCSVSATLCCLFFPNMKGPLLIEFMALGQAIYSDLYCNTLGWLHAAIKAKRSGMLSSVVHFLHDNVWPHMPYQTLSMIKKLW